MNHQIQPKGVFEGYASVFHIVDAHCDTLKPGAFSKAIQNIKLLKQPPKLLWQHMHHCPIGVVLDMEEDSFGLKIKAQICKETQLGKDIISLLNKGAIQGISIGFKTKKSTKDPKTNVRHILEVELFEISLVTFAANPKARIFSLS